MSLSGETMSGGRRRARGRSRGRNRARYRGRLPIRTAAARGCPCGAGSRSRRQRRAMACPGSRQQRRGLFPFREYRCPDAGVRHRRQCHDRRLRGHCRGHTRRTGWIPLRRLRHPGCLSRGHRCYRPDGRARNPRRAATSCRLRPLSRPPERSICIKIRGPLPGTGGGPLMVRGGVLLSHEASLAVPSALAGLTSGFGMGPGVSLPLWPPQLYGDVGPVCGGPCPGNRTVDAMHHAVVKCGAKPSAG